MGARAQRKDHVTEGQGGGRLQAEEASEETGPVGPLVLDLQPQGL